MQVDSHLTSMHGVFDLGSESAGVEAAPTASDSTAPRSFDSALERDWWELIRDVAAIANSGGGQIVVGASIDAEDILHLLAGYTESDFADVAVRRVERPEGPIAVITVGPVLIPMAFSKVAAFPESKAVAGSDKAFPAGTFYFRHGVRSEPGTTADMRAFFERALSRVRRRWLRGIRRVLTAPIPSVAGTMPSRAAAKQKKREQANLQPVRIVTDPDAPALQPQDVDRLYPWRQKDLLRELNARIGRRALNSYDIQAVRRQHRLDERPDFVFNLPGAGRRYSPAVAEWIMEQLGRNPEFFRHARTADHEMLRLRRKKPR